MSSHIPFPALPRPPSWFPGHMKQFKMMLPALLKQTDVVLEIRDSRLPFTSINRTFEGALQQWKTQRHTLGSSSLPSYSSSESTGPRAACERIIVFNKRDLVPEWGFEPFKRAMASKFPEQKILFTSWRRTRDIKVLNEMLVKIAKTYPHIPELNVLVVGMPNVGKSTLLNALRSAGISGPTPKALRTSSEPGLTRAVSTRLKLSVKPLVYAFDSPGVMLPFIGKGDKGAERGIKLALIAGIKDGLYDIQDLASYLLYRLNALNPISPAYLEILHPGSSPTFYIDEFLKSLAERLQMLRRGGEPDLAKAAQWFVNWWREDGGLIAAAQAPAPDSPTLNTSTRRGWGFDLEWSVDEGVEIENAQVVQRKMEEVIDQYFSSIGEDDNEVSTSQERKRLKKAATEKRVKKANANFTRQLYH